jgi:hypothetical protein
MKKTNFTDFKFIETPYFPNCCGGSVTEAKRVNVRFIVNKAVLKHWFSFASYYSIIVPYITARQIYDRLEQKASYHTLDPLLQPQVRCRHKI